MTETETVEVPWNSNRIYTIDYRFKDEPEDYICTAQVGVELDLPDEHPEEWSNEWVSFDCTIMQYFDKYSDFRACWDGKYMNGKEIDTLDFTIVDVYMSKEQLFMHYAPCFNFEYDPDQLLELALKKGFVTDTNNGYKINGNY